MSKTKKQFIKNVGTGWMMVFVTGFTGFVMLPLNMDCLGQELYGISALAISTLTLFSFLSMGMQPSLLRFFSRAIAGNNIEEFTALSSISQLLLSGLGIVGGIGFLCTLPWFISIYRVPETVQHDLFFLFFAIGFDFWSTMFLIPFTAIIQGSNRFDAGNIRTCLSKIIRLVALLFGYSFFTPSLLILAVSTFVGTIYQLSSLIFLAYRVRGNSIFFRSRSLRWNLLPALFSLSALNLVHQVCMGLSVQLPVLIIGKTLGVGMVAAFAPTLLLGSFCSTILMQISIPLVPVASRDIIESGGKNIGRWAIQMGEIVACVGCSIVIVFALFGCEIITAWMGESFAWTGTIVTIVVMGFVFASIQTTSYRLALGGNTSIVPFALSTVAVAIAVSLGTWLGTVYGGWSLLGVALFITLVRLIRNTFYLAFVFSWQLGYGFAEYTWRVHVKPLMLGLLVIGAFYMLKGQVAVSMDSIPILFLASLLASGIYLILCWVFVLQKKTKTGMLKLIVKQVHQG